MESHINDTGTGMGMGFTHGSMRRTKRRLTWRSLSTPCRPWFVEKQYKRRRRRRRRRRRSKHKILNILSFCLSFFLACFLSYTRMIRIHMVVTSCRKQALGRVC
jgi:hypothetical protein